MVRFHAYTGFQRPGLHIWRDGTDFKVSVRPVAGLAGAEPGWVEFEYDLDPGFSQRVRFMLFDHDEGGRPSQWEKSEHQRTLQRRADGAFAGAWFVQDATRVLTADPAAEQRETLRVHLITRRKYRPSRLFIWNPVTDEKRWLDLDDVDEPEPVWEVVLDDWSRSFFCFKFIASNSAGRFEAYEPDVANRLYVAGDGGEIWVHSETAQIHRSRPERKQLRVHFRQRLSASSLPQLHFWPSNAEWGEDAPPPATDGGWLVYDLSLYTDLRFGLQFHWKEASAEVWEHPEAKRFVSISGDEERWTLEGDATLFDAPPQLSKTLTLKIAARPPFIGLGDPLFAHVWVNRARGPLHEQVPVEADGEVSFDTYPDVVTSVRFHDGQRWEPTDRHTVQIGGSDPASITRYVVLGRPSLLETAPVRDVFADPPFFIRRPGAYEQDGYLHFVVHAPTVARMRLLGEWIGQDESPLEMQCTRDGTYWWTRIPRADIEANLSGGRNDYHGVKYKFLLNDRQNVQDPAAGWVENSSNHSWSRLIREDRYVWQSSNWQRPGRDWLIVYQLHVKRFTNRFDNVSAFRRVTQEIRDNARYLQDLGVTAILLLPVNEVASSNGWGYDPAFYYAIEESYGGPDDFKEMVDAAHLNGFAVLVDVVFNHAGTTDNILWAVAPESFFDGDTQWGAMINFDHPQCLHFFAQNLAYLASEFRLDGFRLDHTHTIVHSHEQGWYVRKPGSGGGWDFLRGLRHTLHTQVDNRCLLMAEHLPNEWNLTNAADVMDTQWCDDFHDRLVQACRGWEVMAPLADAMKLSQTTCDDWFDVTNYPESHDEVGNVNDRICNIAGLGRGLRISKVSAAATLFSRGIPMFFMGAESGEHRQFQNGSDQPLDVNDYLTNADRRRVRAWWSDLNRTRGNPAVKGPAPIDIRFAEGQLLAFTRGEGHDFFVVLNFGGWSGDRRLAEMNLPWATYRELWNSTWPAFAIQGEQEDEHTNGGRDVRLDGDDWLHIPDYGAIILERT
jgi:1,4-alpha-glucan branching enzyme